MYLKEKKNPNPHMWHGLKGLRVEFRSLTSKTLYCFPQGFHSIVIRILNSEESYFLFRVESL